MDGRMLLLVFLAIFLVLASMKRWKLVIGAAMIATGASLFLLYETVETPDEDTDVRPAIESIRILYSSDKRELLNAPEFRQLLKKEFGLVVTGSRLSRPDVSEQDLKGMDGIWFSGEMAARRFQSAHPKLTGEAAPVFWTPLVFYSWPEVIRVLTDTGIVTPRENGYVVSDLRKLLQWCIEDRTWASVGLRSQGGEIRVYAADPAFDEAAASAAVLMAEGIRGRHMENAEDLPPGLADLYRKMGPSEHSPQALFAKYAKQGQWAFPVILADESLVAGFCREFPEYRDKIRTSVRVLMPEPTIRISHSFLPLTSKGEKLAKALQAPEFQRFAWESYGFRPATEESPLRMPRLFREVGLTARTGSLTRMPPAEVISALIRTVRNRK